MAQSTTDLPVRGPQSATNIEPPFTLLPPNIDLENVSAFNEDGKRLVQLLSDRKIADKHHTFILGLFSVYSLLIRLGVFEPDVVAFPPHNDFDTTGWLAVGFTPEVVDILSLLPYWTPKGEFDLQEPQFIADQAPFMTYLGLANLDRRGPAPIEGFLKPEHFCLNYAFYSYPLVTYIYDSVNATCQIFDNDSHFADYHTFKFYSAQIIMTNWIRNLYDLVYVWNPEDLGESLRSQPSPPTTNRRTGERIDLSEEELLYWIPQQPLDEFIRLMDFRAMQALYQRNGWPGNWNRAAFLTDVKSYKEEDKRLERLVDDAGSASDDEDPDEPTKSVARRNRLAFLQEIAGDLGFELES